MVRHDADMDRVLDATGSNERPQSLQNVAR
jgi:hypothetical protein